MEKRLALSMFVILGVLALFFAGNKLPANAQAEPQADSNCKIMVVPMQIDRERYGLAMVDTANQTLWIYELNSRGPAYSRLKLLAARSWQYDRLLEQYNTDEPKPEQVKMLLEKKDANERPKKQEDLGVNTAEVNEPNNRYFNSQLEGQSEENNKTNSSGE
ncbi:MAG: hypothetical protein PHY02_04445 [Phycisphaerae bacterium]|nr:hypothetical protein [Phycisphaerae bacterium]